MSASMMKLRSEKLIAIEVNNRKDGKPKDIIWIEDTKAREIFTISIIQHLQ